MTMTQAEWEASVQWVGIIAGCVIRQDGKYLLVQEKQQKVYGLWNLPAGYVDKGESVEHAAVREVKEETGYDVELGELIGLYHEETARPIKHVYKAKIVGGELAVQQDEILDVQWLSYQEIIEIHQSGKLRADWILDAIGKVEQT